MLPLVIIVDMAIIGVPRKFKKKVAPADVDLCYTRPTYCPTWNTAAHFYRGKIEYGTVN